mmetsp:Transcript_5492/g.17790  ORF Transcript_5492/g.17790 Transcript_5492/m.17790 type:complete len:305 (+) Transcript_5492:1359-2273(+)
MRPPLDPRRVEATPPPTARRRSVQHQLGRKVRGDVLVLHVLAKLCAAGFVPRALHRIPRLLRHLCHALRTLPAVLNVRMPRLKLITHLRRRRHVHRRQLGDASPQLDQTHVVGHLPHAGQAEQVTRRAGAAHHLRLLLGRRVDDANRVAEHPLTQRPLVALVHVKVVRFAVLLFRLGKRRAQLKVVNQCVGPVEASKASTHATLTQRVVACVRQLVAQPHHLVHERRLVLWVDPVHAHRFCHILDVRSDRAVLAAARTPPGIRCLLTRHQRTGPVRVARGKLLRVRKANVKGCLVAVLHAAKRV